MASNNDRTPLTTDVLVKLRPSSALRAAETSVRLRPLYDGVSSRPTLLGAVGEPKWFVAELAGDGSTPWDNAHAQIANQLGVDESDVLFAEPDIVHNQFPDANSNGSARGLAVGDDCATDPAEDTDGKIIGPEFAWHLGADFSQLADARAAVKFSDVRTRIGHMDTGYYATHVTLPAHIRHDLERNFVDKDPNQSDAADPDNKVFLLDNSGHGTGTISILAGAEFNHPVRGKIVLGGAPDADVVPVRIADSVVLFKTSAFASGLAYATNMMCDVVTMSMGGLPSRAWREAVDDAYLQGLCLVAAAGNNINYLPTRHVVYPARYGRVIAACGAMANGRPYILGGKAMEGNYGPDSCMKAAIAAYTPNIPWARYGCADVVRENGEGTSAATPQVAAAVALWFEQYKNEIPRDWRRIEAVRNAIFSSAGRKGQHDGQFGNGVLRAMDALGVKPRLDLPQTKSDSDSFAFLRVITGLGITDVPAREAMFNLELTQRWLLNKDLQDIVPDPDATSELTPAQLNKFMDAVVADSSASQALRKHVASRYTTVNGTWPKAPVDLPTIVPKVIPTFDSQPKIQRPPYRRIRVYAVDPSLSGHLDTAAINDVTLSVRWEDLHGAGPVGEYVAVTDVDASGQTYAGVDLNDPQLLAMDGWGPSEGNPQFHQQMVYAVAMKTIEHFEGALGRPILWRSKPDSKNPTGVDTFTRRLTIKPHAFTQANAYYSPNEVALLFGYFEADASDPGDHIPGTRVYACLSHDIVAHETTHAVLDGMHRNFNDATNPDVLAFHEGFADIVALLQHMTIPSLLEHEIARVRGDIEAESLLGSLAVQFGHATGGRGALREAIGHVEGGAWKRTVPSPSDMQTIMAPHERGAILVGAVFDAFIAIYKSRIADLLRIYTSGTGVLPSGAIHPDLVKRLADEAVKAAGHVLNMCIRALDYLPPVDVTFFEYLRALITADIDLVSDDKFNYRVAFVESFRRRGISPLDALAISSPAACGFAVDTLRWDGFDYYDIAPKQPQKIAQHSRTILSRLKRFADACFYIANRKKLFAVTTQYRDTLHKDLTDIFKASSVFANAMGIDTKSPFEVHALRRAMRVGPDGNHIPQVIVSLTQEVTVAATADTPAHVFRGGSTMVVDLSTQEIKYRIVKNINSVHRQERTANFIRQTAADPLSGLYLGQQRNEPFAVVHALADDASV